MTLLCLGEIFLGLMMRLSNALCLQIKLMGTRDNAANHDFSSIPLEEEEESHLKDAAVISMGTEISGEDMLNIEALCDQVQSTQHTLSDMSA